MFNYGSVKMDRSYNCTNESSLYISAIVLNLANKFEYIKRWWPEEWHETASTFFKRSGTQNTSQQELHLNLDPSLLLCGSRTKFLAQITE
jgi:hypothetical protein